MTSTEYSFLGHIFELYSPQDHKFIFQKVLERVKIGFTKHQIDLLSKKSKESKFVPFDDFFKCNEISIESCQKFVTNLLKHYKLVDAFGYSLETEIKNKIEKIVWRILLENTEWCNRHCKYGQLDEDGIHIINLNDVTIYRLFCLFNRFSYSYGNKVRLERQNQHLLLRQLKKVNPLPQEDIDLSEFSHLLHYIHSQQDSFVSIAVKEVYDKYVRDILQEGRVKLQVTNIFIKNGTCFTEVGK